MGKKKLLAGLAAGALMTSVVAAATTSPTSATGGGSDAVFEDTNPGPFTISDATTITASTTIANAAGVVTDVNVRLNDLGHTFPDDIDMEIVAPNGTAVPLMSDMCGATDVEDIDVTFDDEAGAALSDGGPCATGSFKPGNIGAGDAFPVAPTGTTLSHFDGINPNGTWSLRVVDDVATDVGDLEGGFTVTVVTAPFSILIPGTGTTGPASPYPFQIPVSGLAGVVTDVDAVLSNLTYQFVEDLEILLVAPTGQKALIWSDTCQIGFNGVTEADYVLSDEAAAGLPASGPCPSGTYKPTDLAPGDALPVGAPAGPYTSALSVFDGINPNGTWQMFIADDLSGGAGFFSTAPSLNITMSDTTAPNTLLVGKKPENTTKRKVKIKFTSTEAGSTFKCKVDAKAYKPCTSPLKLKNLSLGRHKVLIVATDAAGNKDPKALKLKWKIFPN